MTYFDGSLGRAEPTRLALAIGGQAFEDRRIPLADFARVKREAPWDSLPQLEVRAARFPNRDASSIQR